MKEKVKISWDPALHIWTAMGVRCLVYSKLVFVLGMPSLESNWKPDNKRVFSNCSSLKKSEALGRRLN